MEQSTFPRTEESPDVGEGEAVSPGIAGKRRIIDLLPDSFAVTRSESEWLMTMLGPDELAYIFGDDYSGKGQD